MNEIELRNAIDQYGKLLQALRSETQTNDPLTKIKTNNINNEMDKVEDNITYRQNIQNMRPSVSKQNVQNEQEQVTNQYDEAFGKYIRNGSESDISNVVSKPSCPQELKNDSNGYSITTDMNKVVNDRMARNSAIRPFAKIVNISKDSLDFAVYTNEIQASWGDDKTVAPETDAFERKIVQINELTAQPKITQRMLDDNSVDIEGWIAELLSDIFLEQEDYAFINGDGCNKPTGILSYSEIERVSNGNESNISLDSLLSLQASLPSFYEKDGEVAFVASKKAVAQIRTLKDDSGRYVWTSGILQSKQDLLFGIPLISSGAMPTFASGADAVLYGNFRKGYQIIDRSDIKIQRDPFSAKPFLVYFATKRVGGDVIDKTAIKSLLMS